MDIVYTATKRTRVHTYSVQTETERRETKLMYEFSITCTSQYLVYFKYRVFEVSPHLWVQTVV